MHVVRSFVEAIRAIVASIGALRCPSLPARPLAVLPALIWTLGSGIAHAGDPVAGMALFNNIPDAIISCGNSTCHGPNPNVNVNGLQKAGNNAGVIEAAIRVKVPSMMFLNGLVTPFQLEDLAAYLAPQPELTQTSIGFGGQSVGQPSAIRQATLRNVGGVDLALEAIELSGPDAASFSITGTCDIAQPLASAVIDRPGGVCDVAVRFTPAIARLHQATLTLRYAGMTTFPAKQAIALTGSGLSPAAPAIAVDPPAIDFGAVLRDTTAPPRTLTLSNPGAGPLTIAGIDINGAYGAEFSLSGSCVAGISGGAVEVLPAKSCTIVAGFSPQGTGVRNATITIRHNASGGPSSVPLTGFGLAPTCPPPQPASEFQTLACPAGQNGAITQSRIYACSGTTWIPSPWTTLANNCRADSATAPLALTEYHHPGLDHYFVTADPAERASIESGQAGPGWVQTMTLGHVWNADAANVAGGANRTPVCRFYGNPAAGPDGARLGPNSHFYTADPGECDAVKRDRGWVFEGVVFDVATAAQGQCTPPLIAVRRNYNGRFRENDSNHRYSTVAPIASAMAATGWADEGVVFCIEP